MARLLVLVAVALAAAAGASAASGPTFAPCPTLAEAAHLPVRSAAGSLRGDIEGDGRRDLIVIRYAPRAAEACGFLVVAKTAHGTYAGRLHECYEVCYYRTAGAFSRQFPEPELSELWRIAGRGLEITVQTEHGCCSWNFVLFRLQRGRLARLWFPPHVFYGSEFAVAGSIATQSSLDCVGPSGSGEVVATFHSGMDRPKLYRQVVMTLEGTHFRVVRSLNTRHPISGRNCAVGGGHG